MAAYNGKLLTVDLVLHVFGVAIKVVGTIEILDIRRRVE